MIDNCYNRYKSKCAITIKGEYRRNINYFNYKFDIYSLSRALKNKENLKVGIIIGPEGGIDIKEVKQLEEAGAKIITLGKRILRTETVALAMTSIIMYELG